MSNSVNRDLVYCLRILESISKIQIYASEFSSAQEFFNHNEQINFNATLNLLAQIGENIKKISVELKSNYKEIPWKIVSSFRNKIIHEYTGIDFTITYFVITNELPKLNMKLAELISVEIKNKNFNEEDLKSAIGTDYYKHVDFTAFKLR